MSPTKLERLDKSKAVLLVVDHQVGLFQVVRDYQPDEYKNNILAHAGLGKVFGLPTILTTSAQDGPNGPLPHEILEMHPDAPLIKRNGEVNAWDNAEFREAVKATGRKQVILAGIVTDVCTAFLALSLIEEGYTVFANAEASGAASRRIADDANARMRDAGVHVVSMFAIGCDLMRDWRNTPGALEMFPFYDKYFSAYGMVARGHEAAVKSGQLQPGEPSP
ncbi:Isochorismatase hydrolase [Dendrothele bispora CBS 962.96]|uniref:Isochorismatase hydrolase n=1 Tax=Dendrothele bispora (strain CBS 962.96) TaxID=1314807 RepID=A0A4S8LND9_DENBC|nr:Isochorismatase hydrolase [Dendrothele bispora CBS 962.96]